MELKKINTEICTIIRRTQEELKACTNSLITLEVEATKTQALVNKLETQWQEEPTEENSKALDRAYDEHDIRMCDYNNALEYTEHLEEVLEALQKANRALKSII